MTMRLPSRLQAWIAESRRRFREPRAGLEIAPDAIRGVRLRSVPEGWRLEAVAEVPLPPGILAPAFRGANLSDPAGFAEAAREVVGRLGYRGRRVGVALPDAAVKLRMEALPALPPDPAEIRRLTAWRASKVFRMPPEELVADAHPLNPGEDGETGILAAVALRSVIREYEDAFQAAALDAEPLLPAAIARFNAHAPDLPETGTAAFLAFTAGFAHLALIESGRPVRFHSVRGGADDDHAVRDLALVAEHLRDYLAGRALGAVVLADPGVRFRDAAAEFTGLFDAPLRMVSASRRLAGWNPDDPEAADADRFAVAIGAAAGHRLAGGRP